MAGSSSKFNQLHSQWISDDTCFLLLGRFHHHHHHRRRQSILPPSDGREARGGGRCRQPAVGATIRRIPGAATKRRSRPLAAAAAAAAAVVASVAMVVSPDLPVVPHVAAGGFAVRSPADGIVDANRHSVKKRVCHPLSGVISVPLAFEADKAKAS